MVGMYDGSHWRRRKLLNHQQRKRAGGQPLVVSVNVISDGITRLPILEGEVSHVEIPRGSGVPLGITIVGGSDTPLRCVVIQEIFPDGLAAQDGRLQSGDQIIEIDGVDMTAASHSHVCQELKRNTQLTLRLGIYRERIQVYKASPQANNYLRRHALQNEEFTSITLWQERCRPLGVKLGGHCSQPGIYVVEIQPDSVASLDGRLHLNDRILAINGYDVRYTRLETAVRLVDRSQSSIVLNVATTNYNCDGNSVCSSVTNESLSEECSNSSSPRIYIPSTTSSTSSPHSTVDSGIQSTSSSVTSHYSPSDITDTDDTDSIRSETDRRVTSPIHLWPQSESQQRALVSPVKDNWTSPSPLPPRLNKKYAVIKKAINESLGMRIGGGVASNEGDTPIYIANINPSGPVGKSNHVKKGDVLLSVNGQSLLGLTHGQAVAQLKATAELAGVTLSLLEGPETSTCSNANFVPSWLYWQKLPRPLQISRSVVLQRSPGSSLGFSIVGGADPSRGPEPIHVLLVVASSPAAIDGKLRCGDRILAVDNFSLENVSHSSAVGLLKQAGQRVHLEVVSWLGTEL